MKIKMANKKSLKTCKTEDIPTDNYVNHLFKKLNLEEK